MAEIKRKLSSILTIVLDGHFSLHARILRDGGHFKNPFLENDAFRCMKGYISTPIWWGQKEQLSDLTPLSYGNKVPNPNRTWNVM